MEIIALVKLPLQLGGQQLSYRSFAGAGYTRDHNYHFDSIVASGDGPRQFEMLLTDQGHRCALRDLFFLLAALRRICSSIQAEININLQRPGKEPGLCT
jgi:hypothetical protein